MKTYKSIEETIADVRKKDKRYNYIYFIVILIMIAVIASIIIYTQDKKNKENEETIAKYEMELIEYKRFKEEDLHRTDSITKLVATLRSELVRIEENLNDETKPREDRETVLENVNLAQDQLIRITNNITGNTIVRYYKRKADGSKIERLIQSMKEPSFTLNLKKVSNDNGRYKVNTVWYGTEVNRIEVNTLVNNLRKNGIRIKDVKQFDNPRTKNWKSKAIEIGYEPIKRVKEEESEDGNKIKPKPTTSRVKNSNYKYKVRFYSYKPNATIKNKLITFIRKESYTLTVYPDWTEKHSFFANTPTIFYYQEETKDIAQKLAATLSDNIRGVKFKVQLGNGYGIKASEKGNTFLVHYTQ
ncbi:MAG: hypothetical protein AB8B65_11450 [Kordia sp.]|uniref:hypothetical protein n=1 Tax=Kordia sp. TaxID=1965332 RepID=UPI00385DAD62